MAKAEAILVGLKQVDPRAYQGWDGRNGCWGCELDVDNIERILQPLGFSIHVFKTADATRTSVLQALDNAASRLKKGDTLLFYFSGHGGQQPDENGDELDGQDETLVAYDGEIVDDHLNEIWLNLKSGVRVIMLSDSCNSGTNYRMLRDVPTPTPIQPMDKSAANKMKAQMIHFGGCRDGATSTGYQQGGAFTITLCNVWKDGTFRGDYKKFHSEIRNAVESGQEVRYNEYGPVADAFRKERPFTTGIEFREARRQAATAGAR